MYYRLRRNCLRFHCICYSRRPVWISAWNEWSGPWFLQYPTPDFAAVQFAWQVLFTLHPTKLPVQILKLCFSRGTFGEVGEMMGNTSSQKLDVLQPNRKSEQYMKHSSEVYNKQITFMLNKSSLWQFLRTSFFQLKTLFPNSKKYNSI